jgi:hypothetical protein
MAFECGTLLCGHHALHELRMRDRPKIPDLSKEWQAPLRLAERRGKNEVVELRFFGGLTVQETPDVFDVSPETVMRDWKTAKAWLSSRPLSMAGALERHACAQLTRSRPTRSKDLREPCARLAECCAV